MLNSHTHTDTHSRNNIALYGALRRSFQHDFLLLLLPWPPCQGSFHCPQRRKSKAKSTWLTGGGVGEGLERWARFASWWCWLCRRALCTCIGNYDVIVRLCMCCLWLCVCYWLTSASCPCCHRVDSVRIFSTHFFLDFFSFRSRSHTHTQGAGRQAQAEGDSLVRQFFLCLPASETAIFYVPPSPRTALLGTLSPARTHSLRSALSLSPSL